MQCRTPGCAQIGLYRLADQIMGEPVCAIDLCEQSRLPGRLKPCQDLTTGYDPSNR